MTPPVRVLVVDDSALMRKLIPQILATDSSIQVVGTAMDGNFGLKKIEDLKPQVVTLDLDMPGMGGLEMLKEIMRRHRDPGHRGEFTQYRRRVRYPASALDGGFRFCCQAQRCFGSHAANRSGIDHQDQGRSSEPGCEGKAAPGISETVLKKPCPTIPRLELRESWPLGFLPADLMRSSTYSLSYLVIFPEPF